MNGGANEVIILYIKQVLYSLKLTMSDFYDQMVIVKHTCTRIFDYKHNDIGSLYIPVFETN